MNEKPTCKNWMKMFSTHVFAERKKQICHELSRSYKFPSFILFATYKVNTWTITDHFCQEKQTNILQHIIGCWNKWDNFMWSHEDTIDNHISQFCPPTLKDHCLRGVFFQSVFHFVNCACTEHKKVAFRILRVFVKRPSGRMCYDLGGL